MSKREETQRNLFSKYVNILTMLTKYRVATVESKRLTSEEFVVESTRNGYIRIDGRYTMDPADSKAYSKTFRDQRFCVFMLSQNSKYLETGPFRKLIDPTKYGLTASDEIIIISELKLSSFLRKVITALAPFSVCTYLYRHFVMELPCAKIVPHHRIVHPQDVKKTVSELKITIDMLPVIFEDDAMGIWIGARVGDLVMIINPSEISGKAVSYRRVRAATSRTEAKDGPKRGERKDEDQDDSVPDDAVEDVPDDDVPDEDAAFDDVQEDHASDFDDEDDEADEASASG